MKKQFKRPSVVEKVFYQKLEREIDDHIVEETMLIQTNGEKIGQVNGLAVYTIDDYAFGRPVKITSTTYKGKQGIVDIEKAADLSGAIHTKGIHIITGFLGYEFAQKIPLSLSCNICFEQSYGQIDGDSASSAELYGILSSLSEVPIKQNIATTGSVNQFGEIQPIGGVNEKIEGFFRVCHMKGLKGNEGVMIPHQNKQDLMLGEEVIEAVKNGQFHIYTIKNIWEGIEIITGVEANKVKEKVMHKLENFNS
ncbi:S16 family serine protease [Cellulosilyticum ruminicola]|uniref:S16 family serine protease n=1 Tax=Cellulosilyticum ruminicola TaxID=425254 RepID=UPI0006D0ED51|nr:S16 family serine protease [Cellulosilyticum ruminicola]